MQVVTELTQDHISGIYDVRKTIELKKLDFKSELYNLNSIKGISKFQHLNHITHIELQNNDLKDINELSDLETLEYINANSNLIESYELRLKNLKKLYLSQNRLKQIQPSNEFYDKLTHLDVSSNQINIITDEQIKDFNNLKTFLFNDNRIIYKDSKVFHQFLIGLSQLQKLTNVQCLNNPFIEAYKNSEWENRLAYYMLTEMQRSFSINDQEYKPAMYNNLLKNLKPLDVENKKIQKNKEEEKDIVQVQDMVEEIENCNNNPVQCFTFLQRLNEDVDKLIKNPLNWTKTFYSKIPVEQLNIKTHLFMSLSNFLEPTGGQIKFLSLICKEPDSVKEFCRKTRNELQDENFGEDQGQSYVVSHEQEDKQDEQDLKDDELNDESDNEDETSINFFDRLVYFFSILQNTKYNTQYINCLRIIYHACSCDEKTGKIVAQQLLNTRSKNINFMQIIEDEIQNYLRILKQGNNTLNDGSKQITKDDLNVRYQKFSELIKTYGAIYHFHPFRKELQDSNSILHDLLLILSLEFVDPTLLAAVCEFTRSLLDNTTVVQSKDNLNTIKSKTQKLGQLLPYLGDVKYDQLCKYLGLNPVNLMHQNDEKIQNLIREIVLLFKWFSEKQTKASSKSKGQSKKPDYEIEYESVSSFLEQQGRENNLFKCLAIPNDDVKLVIVECLMTMPVEQWKSQQICVLFNIANSYKSLGAGKTEKVLSNIFMIASKFCLKSDEKKSKDFQIIYAENAVLDVQKVLIKDMERDLREDPDEEQEKIELATACVNFLISLNAKADLRELAKSATVGSTMKKCLLLEEDLLVNSTIPVEIERCWAGKYLQYLLPVLQGKDSLYPYSFVSFRILCRIADNLERLPEEEGEDLEEFDFLYDYDEISEKKYQIFQDRKKKELSTWSLLRAPDDHVQEAVSLFDEHEYKKEFLQAINCNIIQVLINFLAGSNQSQKSMVLESDLKQQFSELQLEYEYKEQMLTIIYKLRDKLLGGKRHQQIGQDGQSEQVANDLNLDIQSFHEESKGDLAALFSKSYKNYLIKGFILLQSDFDEGITNEYIEQGIQYPIVSAQYFKSRNTALLKKSLSRQEQTQEQTFENFDEIQMKKKTKSKYKNIKATSQIPKKLRVLMVSSLLRCIYALCINADNKAKKSLTQVIESKSNMRILTCLCEWAGWNEGNIGAKYLWIVNFVLEQSSEARKIDYIYNYDIISKACAKITKIIEQKLIEDEKSPMTEDDKIVMKELCSTLSTIMQNICKFNWNSLITDEGDESEKKGSAIKKVSEMHSKEQIEQFLLKCNLICTESLLLKVLPFQQFKTFISIATFFMKSSSEFAKKQESEQEIRTRELVMVSLSNLIGTYICGIHSKRQDVMRIFTYSEVFEKKIIRKSYLQNILDISAQRSYEFILEKILEAENKQEGRSNKLLTTYQIHYRDINVGKYKNGLLVRLKQEIRIYEYDRESLLKTLESADITQFKNLAIDKHYKDTDINEILITETEQRLILKIGNTFLNILFLNEKNGKQFIKTYKVPNRKDTFIQEALAYRMSIIQKEKEKDKGKGQQQHQKGFQQLKNYLQWVCINPDLPQDRQNIKNIQNKTLILLDNMQINMFNEKQEHWFYLQPTKGKELMYAGDGSTPRVAAGATPSGGRSKRSSSKETVNSIYTPQQLAKIQNYFYPLKDTLKVNQQIKKVVYDQNTITQATIKTNNQKEFTFLFLGDEERENFRSQMILRINLPKWNQAFGKLQD